MQKTNSIYGALPVDLGLVDLSPSEMMFWLYCPIKLPRQMDCVVPKSLRQFTPIINAAIKDCSNIVYDRYVYITAKTLWATSENPGNRPGWHSDGFLTDDLNYIWCDANPTVFFHDGVNHAFISDHKDSLSEMDALCEPNVQSQFAMPVKHLLRLDQAVLHKVATNINPGVRTFVKISVSRYRYTLRGNSINHDLAPDWEYSERQQDRNCPIGGAK